MEVSGVRLRQIPCLSGAEFDSQPSKVSFSSSISSRNVGELRVPCHGYSKACLRSRIYSGVSRLGFSDSAHLQYYVSSKAVLKKEKENKKKNPEIASLKKKLKLVKGMSKDMLRFSSMGFGVHTEDGLIGEIEGKKIWDATEILLSQLQQLKAEEKELKKRKKVEKAKLRAAQTRTMTDTKSDSSSSSESSDSECGEVINMSSLRSDTNSGPKVENQIFEFPVPVPVQSASVSPNIEGIEDRKAGASTRSCSSSKSSVMIGAAAEKIEVCMGGKCKKSGASALLEELQQRVGIEGAVVGCKCMGKCRDGPNVRIAKKLEDCVRPQTNALCVGVGLEDVGVIVSNFLGEERKNLGLVVA